MRPRRGQLRDAGIVLAGLVILASLPALVDALARLL
jgi:hypothetical protein